MTSTLSRLAVALRPYVVGQNGKPAVLVVALTGVGVALSLGLMELFGLGHSGQSLLESVAFGVLPGLAAVICGWYRLGALAAGGVGLAPGAVVSVHQLATETSGHLSVWAFPFMLTTVTVPIALAGFGVGIAAAILFK